MLVICFEISGVAGGTLWAFKFHRSFSYFINFNFLIQFILYLYNSGDALSSSTGFCEGWEQRIYVYIYIYIYIIYIYIYIYILLYIYSVTLPEVCDFSADTQKFSGYFWRNPLRKYF